MLRILEVSNRVPIKIRVENGSESNSFFNRSSIFSDKSDCFSSDFKEKMATSMEEVTAERRISRIRTARPIKRGVSRIPGRAGEGSSKAYVNSSKPESSPELQPIPPSFKFPPPDPELGSRFSSRRSVDMRTICSATTS